jgi:hypothetical protein
MGVVYRGSGIGTSKVDGQKLLGEARAKKDESDQRQERTKMSARPNGAKIYFRDLAVMAFPIKTEANLAFVADVDSRTARRWLADGNEPPADVLSMVLCEIMRRYHQRI